MPRVNTIDFSGAIQATPQQVQRMRLAEALSSQGMQGSPQTAIEGLNKGLSSAMGGIIRKREGDALKARQDAYTADMATILGGAQAKPWVNPDTGEQVGQAGGLAGALATSDRLQSPEARERLMQMQLAEALKGPAERKFQTVPGVGLVEIPPQGDPRVALGQPIDFNKLLIPGPDGQPVVNQALLGAKKQLAAAGKTTVNNTLSTGSTKYGKVPPGWEMVMGPDGEAVMRPTAGGPVATEAAEKDAKAGLAAKKKEDTGKLVLEDLGRAKTLVKNSPVLTTGFLGNILKDWGGSDASDVSALVDTISANISFEAINAMRQASPTGGALGNVTERELALLSATAGSLAQSQSSEQFIRNLERLEKQFTEVVYGPSTGSSSSPGGRPEIGSLLDKYAPQ